MALMHHIDVKRRFQQQVDNAGEYVIPFIEKRMRIQPEMKILEIGCGEGGVMVPFLKKGCKVTGIELVEARAISAKSFLSDYLESGQAEIINMNIYEEQALKNYKQEFDLIILKDVIEHIHDQQKFIPYLREFLKPEGRVYFGFPPWYMPHGGHQQVCHSKILGALPYIHLLPVPLYTLLLRLFGEHQNTIDELLEVKSTGISIERFERLVRNANYSIENKTFYLLNPIYRFKFGWKPIIQFGWMAKLPFIRNFFTTCVYYLIRK